MTSRWRILEHNLRDLIVWGAADQARVNQPILTELGYKVLCFVVDNEYQKTLSPFKEIPIVYGKEGLNAFLSDSQINRFGYVLAIGNPNGNRRVQLDETLKLMKLTPINFIDKTSFFCKSVIFEDGLQVMPRVIVNNEVKIGKQVIINTSALVEHDCVLGDGVEIGPGAVLCGRVTVGENTFIGANSTIRQRISIGKNVIVGAGAVVVKDIPDNVVVAGVPTKIINT